MRRNYDVSYYEYGLTIQKSRRFFFLLPALIFKLIIDCRYGRSAYARLREIYYETA